MIYTATCVMFFMRVRTLQGGALEIKTFLGPEMARADSRTHQCASGHPSCQVYLRRGGGLASSGCRHPRLRAAGRCWAALSGQLRWALPGVGEGGQGLQTAAGREDRGHH